MAIKPVVGVYYQGIRVTASFFFVPWIVLHWSGILAPYYLREGGDIYALYTHNRGVSDSLAVLEIWSSMRINDRQG